MISPNSPRTLWGPKTNSSNENCFLITFGSGLLWPPPNSKLTKLIVLNKCGTCVCRVSNDENSYYHQNSFYCPNSHYHRLPCCKTLEFNRVDQFVFLVCVFDQYRPNRIYFFDLPFAFYFRSLNRFVRIYDCYISH